MTDVVPTGTYTPSPRPSYDRPTAISYRDVTRHVWGDSTAGEVADWIYASTDKIHCLVFGLAPGQEFRHSPEFRTVFGADEVLEVLSGTLVLANPETGEVLRVPSGERVRFGPDTWHHGFAHGTEPLRVLELYAPPPAKGTSGAYARTKPLLEDVRYATVDGQRPTLQGVQSNEIAWRRDLGVLTGVVANTEHLTVLALEVNPGETSRMHAHAGDEILYLKSGTLWMRAWDAERAYVFELAPRDACFVPAGCTHEYRNIDGVPAVATIGVAPPDEEEHLG
jgi:mannose-6-phosphate isomerase-like protein (cupin superfamily)